MIQSYNEKVTYYENLKEKWSEISSVYEDELAKRHAADVLGANWEEQVLNGNIGTLERFRKDYVSLQQAIADTAWNAANERVKAANKALEAEQSATPTGTGNSGNVEAPVWYDNETKIVKTDERSNNKWRTISKYGKGTKSATPGIHEIAENAPEIVRNNDGTAFLAKEHQLHDFEGGERVYNPSETKQLVEGTKSNVPIGDTSVGNTPIDKINSLQNPDYLRLLQVVEDGLLAPLENSGFIRNAVSVKQPNLQSIQQTVNVTVNNTFPNVTNSGGYEQFNKNMTRFLSGAKLASLTFKNR